MEISVFVFIITWHHKMKYWGPHLHQTNKELGARGFNLQGFDTAVVRRLPWPLLALVAFSPASLFSCDLSYCRGLFVFSLCLSVQKDYD